MGPPGTGKSTTALAFASTCDSHDWAVTWIHVKRQRLPACVRFDKGKKKTFTLKNRSLSELDAILDEIDDDRKHIIFIDGFALKGDCHMDILKTCTAWLDDNRVNRRLVVVCSMSSRGKDAKLEEDRMNGVEEFHVYSWKLEEYLEAVQNNDFFENVKDNLDAGDDPVEIMSNVRLQVESSQASAAIEDLQRIDTQEATPISRADMVRSKFYFAGGCCRFMFFYKTVEVSYYLNNSVAAVNDVMPYITGTIGEVSEAVINRLFCIYYRRQGAGRRPWYVTIVSTCAKSLLAMKGGPELVKNLATVTRLALNPSLDGWLLETWFFALLCKSGVKLRYKTESVEEEWPESIVELYTKIPSLPDGGIWLKPLKWNQGGFDAIFIDKTQHFVRFVQITRADSHSFKIEYFHEFLSKLAKSPSSFEITRLEIVFLVLKEKMNVFQISDVSGEGLLVPFGWKKGEEKEMVTIAGIDGWE
ncbi:hypothetical protein MP638_004124 [Amoeboaphelidium occidentale]|nr:hypothetical protein MP638_004124 [Amoeboaphelidium occidentale]